MQLAFVLLPAERLLLNLIDLVQPQAIVCLFVLILLRLLLLCYVVWHLHDTLLIRLLDVDRLGHITSSLSNDLLILSRLDAISLLLAHLFLPLEALMISRMRLFIGYLTHLADHVIFRWHSYHSRGHPLEDLRL